MTAPSSQAREAIGSSFHSTRRQHAPAEAFSAFACWADESIVRRLLIRLSLLAALLPAGAAHARQVNPADRLVRYPVDPYRSDRAQGCSDTAQPGAWYLQAWLQSRLRVGESWGIRRCRRVREGRSWSLHAEGRAVDWRLDVDVPAEKRAADKLVSLLLRRDKRGNRNALARRMGLQEIIWNCRIWTPKATRLRRYSRCARRKVNRTTAHRDHVHLGLNWLGALAQTSFWRFGATVPAPAGRSSTAAGGRRALRGSQPMTKVQRPFASTTTSR
jgi:hypothetical protein